MKGHARGVRLGAAALVALLHATPPPPQLNPRPTPNLAQAVLLYAAQPPAYDGQWEPRAGASNVEEIVFKAGVIFGDLYTRGDYAARSKAAPAGGDRLSQQ